MGQNDHHQQWKQWLVRLVALVAVVVAVGVAQTQMTQFSVTTRAATTTSSLNKQIKQTQTKLTSAKATLTKLQQQLKTSKAALSKSKTTANQKKVTTLNSKIATQKKQISKLNKTLTSLKKELSKLQSVAKKRTKAVSVAKTLTKKKIPYRWGGSSLSGMDCSGLTMYVYNKIGVSLPHYTVSQEKKLTYESVGDAKPGDLLFWGSRGSSYHVAVYVGNGRYVHAPTTGQNVKTTTISAWHPSFAAHIKY